MAGRQGPHHAASWTPTMDQPDPLPSPGRPRQAWIQLSWTTGRACKSWGGDVGKGGVGRGTQHQQVRVSRRLSPADLCGLHNRHPCLLLRVTKANLAPEVPR